VADPVTFPDLGIWHPLAPGMFEDLKEYLNWNASRKDLSEKARKGPVIGLVLQRSHIVTGDEAHYVAVIQELEYRGATVIPVFCGGLDFTKPVNAFFYDPLNPDVPLVDGVVSLTGFALVGGPARQDHPKAIEVLKKLNRPYMVALPLVFQTTQEWEESDLGLHPVQVALQIAIPELDGAIEPIVLSGRDDATGKAHTLQDRVDAIAERAIRWASLRIKPRTEKKLAITVFSFPPDKGNVGTAAYLDVFGSIHRVMEEMRAKGYDVGGLPKTSKELMEAVLKDPEAHGGGTRAGDRPPHERGGIRAAHPLLRAAGGELGQTPRQPQFRRHQPADLRPPLRQRVCGRAAHLRLRRRPDAAALFPQRQPPPRLCRLLHLSGEGVGRRCGAALRHPWLAGVHARQADGHERNLLPRFADRRPAEPLLLRRQQPLGGHDRQAARLCRNH
jgi:hypothetical protein